MRKPSLAILLTLSVFVSSCTQTPQQRSAMGTGVLIGGFLGMGAGGGIAAANAKHDGFDKRTNVTAGILVGALAGAVAGALIGYAAAAGDPSDNRRAQVNP